ncbi:MAG: isoaspartyl peptidase/L-asparaginase family protein [Nitrososphaerales archaeon]
MVHGGAGSFTPGSKSEFAKRRAFLQKSAAAGYRVLEENGASVDAVEAAIRILENSGVFNAGAGSCLTLTGEILTDASIMTGDLSCGAVAAGNVARNPISLARAVMEKSDHVLIVGSDNLANFAQSADFTLGPVEPNALRKRQYRKFGEQISEKNLREWPKNIKLVSGYKVRSFDRNDTVGAVSIDKRGKLCAGVSTGGRWLKLPGRVGDSAVVGAGLYADATAGAASATGAGEEIIRVSLCKSVCDLMRLGVDAQSACDAAINILSERRGIGTAGVIAVDRFGRFGAARNTEVMTRAFRFNWMRKTHVAFLPHEQNPKLLSASTKSLRF